VEFEAAGFEYVAFRPYRVFIDPAADHQIGCVEVGDHLWCVDWIAQELCSDIAWVVVDDADDICWRALDAVSDVFGVLS